MINYHEARKNMVQCQLETNGIVEGEILGVYETVAREAYLPDEHKPMAYVDEELEIENVGCLLEPLVLARLLQAAHLRHEDIVLNIGDVTGYSSAILSNIVTTIVTPESKKGLLDNARAQWIASDYCNIAVIDDKKGAGCPAHAPYNLIIINGAVESVPDHILDQLDNKGRLVTIIKKRGAQTGVLTLYQKNSNGQCSSTEMFDASAAYLEQFSPCPAFVF